ncbi:dTDP-4-dehydrorhamnose 3,5-epimerase [Clostridia bacterium]|nr:dTDP-4-dehydrorhamnose 3,5-epimerase [Clostridia bacterium]
MFTFTGIGSIPALKIITPFFAEDERGFFRKNFERDVFLQNGIDFTVNESFETLSRKNVIRGLHFQTCNPQKKLVSCSFGEIFDVAVDMREDSPTYLKWHGEILSGVNRKMFYIPDGFAHGFQVLSEKACVGYLCCGVYDKATDGGIRWNDPTVGVRWKEADEYIVSDKDSRLNLVNL